jgi:hypothetical protein
MCREAVCRFPLWAKLIHSTPDVCHISVLMLFTHLCLDLKFFPIGKESIPKLDALVNNMCMQNASYFLSDIVS